MKFSFTTNHDKQLSSTIYIDIVCSTSRLHIKCVVQYFRSFTVHYRLMDIINLHMEDTVLYEAKNYSITKEERNAITSSSFSASSSSTCFNTMSFFSSRIRSLFTCIFFPNLTLFCFCRATLKLFCCWAYFKNKVRIISKSILVKTNVYYLPTHPST